VIGVGVGVQKADGNCLDSVGFKNFASLRDVGFIQRRADFATGEHSLRHL
jgi:hypothetical protein